MDMPSSGLITFLGSRNVETFPLPPHQREGLFVSLQTSWPLYKCYRLLSIPPLNNFANYLSASGYEVGSSCLWHLETTEYCILSVFHFLVFARDRVGYHRADSRLLHLSHGLLAPLSTRLRTHAYNSGFRHFIDGSFFAYASLYVVFHCLGNVDSGPCDKDERWVLLYVRFWIHS